MGKKQSMRWSAEGAHQLLQVRCAVLDGQLARVVPWISRESGFVRACYVTGTPRFVPGPFQIYDARNAAATAKKNAIAPAMSHSGF
jgi:hypothetical protein